MDEGAGQDEGAAGGGPVPGHGAPAFRSWRLETSAVPVLLAAPHGGRAYAPALLAQMRRPDETRLKLEDRHVDSLAQLVARQLGAALIVAEAPRALIDLNRAPDDIDWSMVAGRKRAQPAHSQANRRARSGLGLVPRRLVGLGEIWKRPLEEGDLAERVALVHRPYHQALGTALEALRDRWGAVLLVDLHSMPPLRAPEGGPPQTELVLGDRFGASCDPALSALALRALAQGGRPVAHNRPYAGGYGLERHAAPRRGIHALQIEVCRSLYLDETRAHPTPRLAAVARHLAAALAALAAEVGAIGRERRFPQAAE